MRLRREKAKRAAKSRKLPKGLLLGSLVSVTQRDDDIWDLHVTNFNGSDSPDPYQSYGFPNATATLYGSLEEKLQGGFVCKFGDAANKSDLPFGGAFDWKLIDRTEDMSKRSGMIINAYVSTYLCRNMELAGIPIQHVSDVVDKCCGLESEVVKELQGKPLTREEFCSSLSERLYGFLVTFDPNTSTTDQPSERKRFQEIPKSVADALTLVAKRLTDERLVHEREDKLIPLSDIRAIGGKTGSTQNDV